MGVGRWAGLAPLDFEIFSNKKVVFLLSSGKKQISPLLTPLEKFLKNPPVSPLWKKPFRRPCVLQSVQ